MIRLGGGPSLANAGPLASVGAPLRIEESRGVWIGLAEYGSVKPQGGDGGADGVEKAGGRDLRVEPRRFPSAGRFGFWDFRAPGLWPRILRLWARANPPDGARSQRGRGIRRDRALSDSWHVRVLCGTGGSVVPRPGIEFRGYSGSLEPHPPIRGFVAAARRMLISNTGDGDDGWRLGRRCALPRRISRTPPGVDPSDVGPSRAQIAVSKAGQQDSKRSPGYQSALSPRSRFALGFFPEAFNSSHFRAFGHRPLHKLLRVHPPV